jgi:hypothetical protein
MDPISPKQGLLSGRKNHVICYNKVLSKWYKAAIQGLESTSKYSSMLKHMHMMGQAMLIIS